MKTPLAVAAVLAMSASLAAAQSVRTDTNVRAPGQQMQMKGSVKGSPGASGYAPGRQMQTKGSVRGTTGASGYAPGRVKTDTRIRGDVDVRTR